MSPPTGPWPLWPAQPSPTSPPSAIPPPATAHPTGGAVLTLGERHPPPRCVGLTLCPCPLRPLTLRAFPLMLVAASTANGGQKPPSPRSSVLHGGWKTFTPYRIRLKRQGNSPLPNLLPYFALSGPFPPTVRSTVSAPLPPGGHCHRSRLWRTAVASPGRTPPSPLRPWPSGAVAIRTPSANSSYPAPFPPDSHRPPPPEAPGPYRPRARRTPLEQSFSTRHRHIPSYALQAFPPVSGILCLTIPTRLDLRLRAPRPMPAPQ